MTYSILELPCRDRWPRDPRRVSNVVIHVNVGPEVEGGAYSLARFTQHQQGAYNECVDDKTVVITAHDNEKTAGVTDFNTPAYHVCIIGEPDQSPMQWHDSYSRSAWDNAAARTALACQRFGLPASFVGAADLQRGKRGVTGHVFVSNAFHKSDHWDPGPNFPWTDFIGRVQHYASGVVLPMPHTLAQVHPLVHYGQRGSFVTKVQHELNVGTGQHLREDGVFGPSTLDAVRSFQAFFKLTVDGVVGPATWGILDYCYALHGGKP